MLGSALAILALIALSAFFSGSEMSFASANELRLRNAADDGCSRAQRLAYWIYLRYDMALTTLLIGNNLANTAASSIATLLVITLLGNGYAWLATVAMTLLLLIFGEILPKTIAKEMPERFATAVALPLRALMWLTYPLVYLVQAIVGFISRLLKRPPTLPGVTEEDLEVIFDTAEDEGSLDGATNELLQSALEFDDVMAYEIITPRVDMLAVDIDDPIDTIINTAVASTFSRLPVFEESKDNIIGILHVTKFLKRLLDDPAPTSVRDMLLPACFVPETAVLPAVLSTMRQRSSHLVIVCDEYGGTLGLLTMEDILEELVGDIWDETDEVNGGLTLLPDGRFEASGAIRLHDLFHALDFAPHDFPFESTTLGGWIAEMLAATPQAGDHFAYGPLDVTVLSLHKHRVEKACIGLRHGEGEAPQADIPPEP